MATFRRATQGAIVALGVPAALLLAAGPAAAHVTVSSPAAIQGGYSTLVFKVPTESATASTTELKVQLPADQPLAYVAVQPVTGWTITMTKTKLTTPITSDDGSIDEAVTVIDWKANSADVAIAPGQFQQFPVSAGPLPKSATITFKAIQTYDDGSIVNWTDIRAAGSTAEPEHPAPTLALTAAASAASAASATSATSATSASASSGPTVSATTKSVSENSAKANAGLILGSIGVVLGLVAIIVAATRRGPRAS